MNARPPLSGKERQIIIAAVIILALAGAVLVLTELPALLAGPHR